MCIVIYQTYMADHWFFLKRETVLLPSITTIHRLGGMSGNQSEASSFGRLHPAIAILVGYV